MRFTVASDGGVQVGSLFSAVVGIICAIVVSRIVAKLYKKKHVRQGR